MGLNLVSLISQHLSGPVLTQLSGLLGESADGVQKAIGGAVPAVVAGMMNKAATPEGAGEMLGSLQQFGQERELLADLPNILSGDDATRQSLLQAGSNFLKSFMDRVAGSLSQLSGIGEQSASSLLSVVAPVAVSVLGKQQDDLGLDAGGLSRLLMEQKDAVAAALPKELSGALKLDNLSAMGAGLTEAASASAPSVLDSTNQAANQAATAAGYEPSTGDSGGGGFGKLIIGVVVIAVIAWAVYTYFLAPLPAGG